MLGLKDKDSASSLHTHRMHRSSVRPFFCCGSQLSLTSVSDYNFEVTSVTELSDTEEIEESASDVKVKSVKRPTANKRIKKCDSEKNSKKHFWRKKISWTQKARARLDKEACKCTSYTKRDSVQSGSLDENQPSTSSGLGSQAEATPLVCAEVEIIDSDNSNIIDFEELYPTEDVDERRIAERAREMEVGIDINGETQDIWLPQHYGPSLGACASGSMSHLTSVNDLFSSLNLSHNSEDRQSLLEINIPFPETSPCAGPHSRSLFPMHSQIDFMHCLVPDIRKITHCSFYWGIMDRYQAEKLLENKPEGTFLLRDSAQEEFLFSVSFRRYGRSLHARIEQWNHNFSFDSHDPGVFASDTVCGLIEHYKDPTCCMFFEPMLTSPLTRNFTFSLQHMCRASICEKLNYDGISSLPLPPSMREYLKYYHYKQKVRVRRFDN